MIVGENILIRGAVEGEGDLTVRGRIEGSVRVTGAVTIEPDGWIAADVAARAVVVLGTMQGRVAAAERIEVGRGGRMAGDAAAPSVSIAAGAAFLGKVEMGDLAALAALGPVDRRTEPRPAGQLEAPARRQLAAGDGAGTEKAAVKPAAVVEKPAAVVEKPAAVVEKPAAVVEKPAAVVEKPTAVVEKSAAVVQKAAAAAAPGPRVVPPLARPMRGALRRR